MKIETELKAHDLRLAESLHGFLPSRIYDIHAHFYHHAHYTEQSWTRRMSIPEVIDHASWRASLAQNPAFCGKHVSGLFFGAVARDSKVPEVNAFIRDEVTALNDPFSQALLLVTPDCDREGVRAALRSGAFKGIKVYHCYASRPDTMNAEIPEYLPEWMWESVEEVKGVIMLHMVLPRAVADERNQREIRRLCTKYPGAKLVLAHAARCFSHRHAVGMAAVADLPNVYVDTSAVCEAGSFTEALRQFGPRRLLYGSDFYISEFRGRCVTMGEGFQWYYGAEAKPEEAALMTLVGIESLLALREALEQYGATAGDLEGVFWGNAVRLLGLPIE